MKHQSAIDRIRSNQYSRAELIRFHINAQSKLAAGDADAQAVIDEIDRTTPADTHMVFMGFCPGADINNRLDMEWKEQGICTFIYLASEHQLQRFNDILPGDLIVLKKRQEFGRSMRLYGYGRVTGVKYDQDDRRYLEMNWSEQDKVIEVPLMGCNSTVDVKSIEQVEAEMPREFYSWLNPVAGGETT